MIARASLIAAVALSTGLPARAQMQPPHVPRATDPRAIVSQAEALVDAGRPADAVEMLRRFSCPSGDTRCASQIRFATAYAYDDLSNRSGEAGYARRAQQLYEGILEGRPDDPQVLVNIARIQTRLGEPRAAAATFARAAGAAPERAALYLLAAADALRDAKEYGAASEAYVRAGEAGSTEAWSRLVSMRVDAIAAADSPELRKLHLEAARTLAADLRRRGATGPALEALQAVVRYGRDESPETAGLALAEWVEIQALNGTLSESALALLPSDDEWESTMRRSLGASVKSGEWRFGDAWIRTHRYAAMAAAKAIADGLVAAGDATRAEPLYERVMELGYQRPSPGKPDLFLAAAIQLARLYAVRKMPDELEQLEDRLFQIKGEAYRSHDLAAMQRMHAVLGTIYEERNIWSSSYPARNATFQYARLVAVAEEREKKDGIFQPLPHYAVKAAEGYRREGRAAEARELEIDAARGYLELDALAEAGEALARVSASAPDDPRVRTLKKIVTYRDRIAELPTTRDVELPEWKAAGTLDAEFIARQEFRALSDLADRAKEKDEQEEAGALYLRAFENALRQQVLTGTGDELRLERIRASVAAKPAVSDPSKSGTAVPKTDNDPRTWTIRQSGAAAARVVWPAEVVEQGVEKSKAAARSSVKPPG